MPEAQFSQISEVRRTLIDEIFNAFGIPPTAWLRRFLWPLALFPAHRFARLITKFEHCTAQHGFPEAARRLLMRFIHQLTVSGAENIPPEGPLLIASNHPGGVDGLAIAASLPREDLKIVVSGVPFFQGLRFVRDHMIYTAQESQGRFMVVRSAIRHLKNGGSVLIFPSGLVDPDPALFPNSVDVLGSWSSSLALMLDNAPGTRLLVTSVSGVLALECWRNPLVRLRRTMWEQQKLAEFIQIIQQLVLGRRFSLVPNVRFDVPITLPELRLEEQLEDSMQAVLAHARRFMQDGAL